MPDQALSKIHQLAGFKYPAVRQTLQHFLNLSQQPGIAATDLIASIELDPGLLSVFLSSGQGGKLDQWFVSQDVDYFKQVALTIANQFSSAEDSELEQQYFSHRWMRSLLHSLLCESLARRIHANHQTYKLLGLLASTGHHLLAKAHGETYVRMVGEAPAAQYLIQAEQEKFGCGGDELGAQTLKSWGYSASLVDAIRYQYVELSDLGDATEEVKIVAYAGHLLELVQRSDSNPGLVASGSILFNLADGMVGEIVEEAEFRYRQILEELSGQEQQDQKFRSSLATANIATSLERSVNLDSQSFTQTANLVFGVSKTIIFHLDGSNLRANLPNGEIITIAHDSQRSQIAQSYQQEKLITAEETALVSIVDKQLLDRLGTSALWSLPLGAQLGVLVCGLDQAANTVPEFLLETYRLAVIQQIRLQQLADVPTLDLEFVRKRVSEVTHEVNNPLAIVQNYLRTLSLKLEEDSPVQADIETISRELMRVAGIVQKYSQIGRQEDLLVQEVNVNDILTGLIGIFSGGQEEITFDMNLDQGMPLVAITPDSLKQVIVNIVKNATEALSEIKDGLIAISSHGSINLGGEQYIEILIQDNGPGIPLPTRDKLFQSNNTSKGGDHSGLGLSIVKQLVAEMGGLISCKSQLIDEGTGASSGTSFQILIPLVITQE